MIAREYYLGILSSRRYIPLFTSSVQWLFRLSCVTIFGFLWTAGRGFSEINIMTKCHVRSTYE